MSKRRYVLDTRIFAVFFFVAMPFVAFGSFVVVSMARGALQEDLGHQLEQRAVETKLRLEHYVSEQIAHLRLLSLDPAMRKALADSQNRRSSDEAVLREAAATTPLAERLRAVVQVRPAIRLLQIVDSEGLLVASSSRGGKANHAESDWFRSLVRDFPEPRAYVSDVYRPGSSSLAVYEIAFPVYDREAGLWLGAILGYLDASDLYAGLAAVRLGKSGHADLIRSTDGLMLAADESDRVLSQTFPGFQYLQASKTEASIPSSRWYGRSYWVMPEIRDQSKDGAPLLEPARIVAYSLVEQIPNVEWLVVVEQNLEEATEAIEGVTRYLWIHFIGAFGTVILLALYFSFKLESPVIEESLHLHEQHVPRSMRTATEE